ncbi:hypothetical protein OAG68_02715 [bacterium]|nr:hypothetical protein [bacterium]
MTGTSIVGFYGITSGSEIADGDPLRTVELNGDEFDSFENLMQAIGSFCRPGLGTGLRLISMEDALVGGIRESLFYAESVQINWRSSDRSRRVFDHRALASVLDFEIEFCTESDEGNCLLLAELANAKAGIGPTLFDAILSVFAANLHIKLVLA